MSGANETKLIEVAAQFLKADRAAFSLESGPGDLPQWDSFAQVGLIAEVEARFGVSFDVEEITMFETLQDIHDAIRARAGERADGGLR